MEVVDPRARVLDAEYFAAVQSDEFLRFVRRRLMYHEVPLHDWDGLTLYLTNGVPCGSFLQAVIDNDLREAVLRGDPENVRALPHIVEFMRQVAPVGSWGFDGAHGAMVAQFKAWRERKGAA